MKSLKRISAVCTASLALTSAAWAESCNNLDVNVLAKDWSIVTDAVSCDHGAVVDKPTDKKANFTTIGTNGPDCSIVFIGPATGGNKGYAFVRFQQNYCVTEGGTITVEVKEKDGDKPIVAVQEGSFRPPTDGRVTILNFVPDTGKTLKVPKSVPASEQGASPEKK